MLSRLVRVSILSFVLFSVEACFEDTSLYSQRKLVIIEHQRASLFILMCPWQINVFFLKERFLQEGTGSTNNDSGDKKKKKPQDLRIIFGLYRLKGEKILVNLFLALE